jgi:hypothetical protein
LPVEWFRRLGDIPGLAYDTPTGIDRTAIPGHDVEPNINRVELLDGKVYESVQWPPTFESPSELEPLSTSRAPMTGYIEAFYDEDERRPASQLIQRIHEALELPGRGSDYHFALQRALSQLRSRMLEAPEVLSHIERLAWLDIKLALAYPQAVSSNVPEDTILPYRMEAFETLVNLYAGEGFLNEAVEVARVAQQLEQGDRRLEMLQERLAAIRAEDDD